ncbi:MAG: PilZ domain-containing protein [Spirochaetes bacterium]|nr:PilZ domain-containing protein [Spirochaetota bacterium]
MDRRKSPRIKIPKNKPGFNITLTLKRFFFKDREVLCRLRDISEGGASLLINEEYARYVTERCIGARAQMISESPELSFRLWRKGRVMRVIKNGSAVTVVIVFTGPAVQA